MDTEQNFKLRQTVRNGTIKLNRTFLKTIACNGKLSEKNTFNILHQNIQSFRNKAELLEVALLQNNYNIICISEHWLNSNQPLILNGYTVVTRYSRNIMKNGGVAILAKSQLKCNVIPEIINFVVEQDFECVGAVASINTNINIIILTIYRAPKSNFSNFITKLNDIMEFLTHKYKNYNFVIVGDFNIDFKDHESNHFRQISDTLLIYGLDITIHDPTRITPHSSTCIDNIFTDINCNLYTAETVNYCLADHFGQHISINCNTKHIESPYYKYRVTSSTNLHELNSLLKNISWPIFDLSEDNVDVSWNYFISTLKHQVNLTCPLKPKIKTSTPKPKWITTGIILSSLNLKKLYYLTAQFKLNSNLKLYYNKYKYIYRKVVRLAKKMNNCEQINKSNNKTKTVWKIINKTTKEKSSNIIDELNIGNRMITDKKDIANYFNNYFSKVPEILTGTLKPGNEVNVSYIEYINKSIFLQPVTENEIYNITYSLKNTNSAGIDEITSKIVKSCIPYIVAPLQHLINLTLKHGSFPTILKQAIIKPIYKKGNKANMENYRPIALLSVFSKILEKCVASRIYSFLNKFNILNKNQFGFRKNLNTSDAVIKLLNTVYKSTDDKYLTLAIFADLSKAFDCVDHKILLKKLDYLGIRGVAHSWIASYLSNRTQIVKIGSSISSPVTLTSSVPQGSVIGPLLYILYVNDFPNSIKNGLVTQFADDTSCLQSSQSLDNLVILTNTNLNKMSDWFKNNKLVLNSSKTATMMFNVPNECRNPINKQLSLALKCVEHTKFLGITIDVNFSWKIHINEISVKLARACFCLRKIKQLTNFSTCKTYYYSNFQSILCYGITCWGIVADAHRIFVLQKKAMRIMCGEPPRTSCKDLFKKHKILPFPCIYILETLILGFKKKSDFNLLGDTHDYNTRNGKRLLMVPKHRTCLYERSPYYMAVKLFNKLPEYIKVLKSLKKFKQHLKDYLLEKCFYSLTDFFI